MKILRNINLEHARDASMFHRIPAFIKKLKEALHDATLWDNEKHSFSVAGTHFYIRPDGNLFYLGMEDYPDTYIEVCVYDLAEVHELLLLGDIPINEGLE